MVNVSSRFIAVKPIPVSTGHSRISISSRMALVDQKSSMSVIIWLWIGRTGWMDVILGNRDISLSSSCIMRWRRAKYDLDSSIQHFRTLKSVK